jgi:cell division septal protein FtsQ
MKNLVKALFYIIVPALLIVSLAIPIMTSEMFQVETVELKGLTPENSPPYLLEQAKLVRRQLNTYIGKKIWNISINDIVGALVVYPWVSNASVSRWFPNTLQVTLSSKVPVAGLLKSPRELILVADDGSTFPSVAFDLVPDVVILTGAPLFEKKEMRKQALQVYMQVPESGLLKRSKVAEMNYQDNVGYTLTLVGGSTRVILGEKDFALRLARVEKVLSYLQSKRVIARVIDANYQKKVLVRPRKGS